MGESPKEKPGFKTWKKTKQEERIAFLNKYKEEVVRGDLGCDDSRCRQAKGKILVISAKKLPSHKNNLYSLHISDPR